VGFWFPDEELVMGEESWELLETRHKEPRVPFVCMYVSVCVSVCAPQGFFFDTMCIV
jgi:hypothetical protein